MDYEGKNPRAGIERNSFSDAKETEVGLTICFEKPP